MVHSIRNQLQTLDYHQAILKSCNFNMIGSDECKVVADKIHEGQMSKWHFAWLIPVEILCNVGAILFSLVSAIAHLIMGVALTIFAACASDRQKKLEYNARAAEHIASSLSAITDKIATCIVRLVMPTTETYSCVKQSIETPLLRTHLTNYYLEDVSRHLRGVWQQQGQNNLALMAMAERSILAAAQPIVEQAVEADQVDQLGQLMQQALPQIIQRALALALGNQEPAGLNTGFPQAHPQGGPQNWGGLHPVRTGQQQQTQFGAHGTTRSMAQGVQPHRTLIGGLGRGLTVLQHGPEDREFQVSQETLNARATSRQARLMQMMQSGATPDVVNQAMQAFDQQWPLGESRAPLLVD